jgi:hypothetical protein
LSGKDAVLRREKMKKNSGFLAMFLVLAMMLAMAALMGACEDSESAPEEREVYIGGWTVTTEEELKGAVAEINGHPGPGIYTITLAEDIETTEIVLEDGGVKKTTVIRGDGQMRTITNKGNPGKENPRLFTVWGNNTLELGKNVTLNGGEKWETAVYVDGGALVMKDDSKITQAYECGVLVADGTFTMEGGVISENKAGGYAGGGGVNLAGGEFKMTGGTISGNSSLFGGGGVFVDNGSTFTMQNGTISGNTADYVGGGVFVGKVSTFTMQNGTISGNNAKEVGGGGVYVENDSIFTKSDGTIYGYPDGDNSNIVGTRDDNGDNPFESRGHAVCVGIRPDKVDEALKNISKIRDTTAGLEDDVLSYDGKTASPIVLGDWDDLP